MSFSRPNTAAPLTRISVDISWPTWGELLKFAPITTINVAVLALGYWAGRKSNQPFIDFLTEEMKRRKK